MRKYFAFFFLFQSVFEKGSLQNVHHNFVGDFSQLSSISFSPILEI